MHDVDYVVILAYFALVIYIGIRVKKSVHSSEDFFSLRAFAAPTAHWLRLRRGKYGEFRTDGRLSDWREVWNGFHSA